MSTALKLSLIAPTYNEEKNIVAFLARTHEVLKRIGATHELIVVDDASKDRTRAEVRRLQKTIPEIRLIEREGERGVATAMVRGYEEARGEYLGAMDTDLAHDPAYLPEMLRLIENHTADFVIGSRYVAGSRFLGKPLLHRIASYGGQFFVKLFLRLPVKDTSNNYRIFRRAVWDQIKNRLHPEGNVMLTEIVYRAHQRGFRIVEIPTIYHERRVGKSKLNIARETFRFFKNILKVKWG